MSSINIICDESEKTQKFKSNEEAKDEFYKRIVRGEFGGAIFLEAFIAFCKMKEANTMFVEKISIMTFILNV